MPAVFTSRSNFLAWLSLTGLIGLLLVAGLGLYLLGSSTYASGVGLSVPQPVPFSHAHHVGGLGIDCRYCHQSVDIASSAGLPPTATCMNCHAQLWTRAQALERVRKSWREGKRLKWNRVTQLADYVYFDHSAHVTHGIGCSTCHGRIDRMPRTYQAETLFMQWCLDCHRNPEPHLRPPEQIYNQDWRPPPDQDRVGPKLAARYHIQKKGLTNCSTCHR